MNYRLVKICLIIFDFLNIILLQNCDMLHQQHIIPNEILKWPGTKDLIVYVVSYYQILVINDGVELSTCVYVKYVCKCLTMLQKNRIVCACLTPEMIVFTSLFWVFIYVITADVIRTSLQSPWKNLNNLLQI